MRYALVTETWPPEVNGVALTVQGLARGLSGDPWEARLRRHAQRSVEVFRIWNEVFGDDEQIAALTKKQACQVVARKPRRDEGEQLLRRQELHRLPVVNADAAVGRLVEEPSRKQSADVVVAPITENLGRNDWLTCIRIDGFVGQLKA